MSQFSDKELEGKAGFKETKRLMEEEYSSPEYSDYVVPIVVLGLVFPLIVPKSLRAEQLANSFEDKIELKIKGIMELDIQLSISKKTVELIKKYREKMIGYVKFYLKTYDKGKFCIVDISVDPFNLAQTFC